MIKNQLKAVIYARQSSGDEVESASVEQQIEACKEIAEKNGYEVVAIEADRNISGRTYPLTDSAIEFSKMDIVYQKYMENEVKRKKYRQGLGNIFSMLNKIDVVIVYDSTRLMRPLTDSFLESYVKQNFTANNIQLSTKQGLITFDNFSDNLVNTLESRINDNQILLSKQKSMSALQRLRDEGYLYTGASLFGFKSVGRQKVAIVEDEIEIVKKIFKWMADGKAQIDILRLINADKTIKRKYTYNDLLKISKRLAYCGLSTNSKGEIIESKVYPRIISFELFQAVQDRLNNQKHKNKDKSKIHPLSGLVYCGYCDRPMIILKSQPFYNSSETDPIYYYNCMADYERNRRSDNCKLATIREFYHTPNLNGLKEAVLPLLIKCIEKELENKKSEKVDKDSILIELEKISRLETILDRKLVDGDITESEYEKRFAEYRIVKKDLQKQLISANADKDSDIEKQIKTLLLYISTTNKIDDEKYKFLAQRYIEKISVIDESITVQMQDGFTVTIERMRVNNTRCLPQYSLNKENGKYQLVYFYKTAEKNPIENILADDETMTITAIGTNPKPYEYIAKRKQYKRLSRMKRNRKKAD